MDRIEGTSVERNGRRRCLSTLGRGALAASLPAVAALNGCAGLGLPGAYTLTQAQLLDVIARQFPRTERVAQIADLTLSQPKLWLLPESNRLGVAFALGAAERLTGRSASGQLSLDSAVRFEPSDHSIRLSQVRVQQFQLEGGGSLLPMQGQRVAALLAERLLENLAVYRLRPEHVQLLRATGLDRPGLAVTSRGLEIALAGSVR